MKLVQKRSKKAGLSPGTLIHIGEQKDTPVKVSLLAYAGDRCEEQMVTNPDELRLPDDAVTWIDIGGVHEVNILETIGKRFNLHPLLLEDIANTLRIDRVVKDGRVYDDVARPEAPAPAP